MSNKNLIFKACPECAEHFNINREPSNFCTMVFLQSGDIRCNYCSDMTGRPYYAPTYRIREVTI